MIKMLFAIIVFLITAIMLGVTPEYVYSDEANLIWLVAVLLCAVISIWKD